MSVEAKDSAEAIQLTPPRNIHNRSRGRAKLNSQVALKPRFSYKNMFLPRLTELPARSKLHLFFLGRRERERRREEMREERKDRKKDGSEVGEEGEGSATWRL